jgi:hypothetical protein
MIDVVCVLWGTKYSIDYVTKLKAMVERNTTIPHRFVCLIDDVSKRKIKDTDTTIFYLDQGYEGWWNKIQLFNPRYPLSDRVVYIDLDTLIVDNIDWLLEYEGDFMGIEDLGAVNAHQPFLKNRFQSGVLAFNHKKYAGIWSEFIFTYERIFSHYRGDGEFLHDHIKRRDLLQNLYPGKLKSYKYQVYPGPPDNETSIICFHGRPSIPQAMTTPISTPMRTYHAQSWIEDYWKE